jgi:hypothetical protein
MAASPETTTRPAEESARATAAAPAAAPATTGSGRATAALILGILSIPAALIPILAVALGVVGLVLGVTARKDMRRAGLGTGKATAAIVCSSIGIGLGLVIWIATAAAIISNNSS